MRRRALALAAALAVAGCTTGKRLHARGDAVLAQVEQAKQAGAMRCAPRELALAEANVDFANLELRQAHAGRARGHLAVAEENAARALAHASDCTPPRKRVDVPLPPPPTPARPDADRDGIPDEIDRCPLAPEDVDGFQDEDGCPDPDDDGDGLADAQDACPREAGPAENRGCPEPDRDRDGIADRVDRCPEIAGVPPDGCPRHYTLVAVTEDRIAIRRQVHFASARFRVLPDSYPLLEQVVAVLADEPGLRIRVEGHTDDVGPAAVNQRLSQRRAEAVRAYLVARGVSPGRVEAAGYGAARPLTSNRTALGRARNRRTEFRIAGVP